MESRTADKVFHAIRIASGRMSFSLVYALPPLEDLLSGQAPPL